ncbi:MAG TPA: glycosyltransferase [Pyrinomonadaceae bacterium]
MARIVLATFGSLGDLHPMLALAIELRRRGHEIVVNTLEVYREKIDALGFEFFPMRPNLSPEDDRELARRVMDAKTGTEMLLKEILLPNVRPMYDDLSEAVKGADLFVTGEVVFAAKSVSEKTGIRWVTTSLAPASFLSAYDPFVPPTAQWLKHFRFLGSTFYGVMYGFIRRLVKTWLGDYRKFRRELGLNENHDPVFEEKFSNLLHLALFSKVLGKPQPDWHSPTLQCGFCFYDGQSDLGKMPAGLQEFLDAGESPIVFTLGSAAVMDARDFFEQSAEAARVLKRRAVLLYGIFNEPPKTTLDETIVAFDYAPYSMVFPKAACVVHQGGVGTTAQVLRAGVPHLFMPYSHDQPDNAARCERIGAARVISRDKYTAQNAAVELRKLLSDLSYKSNALEAKRIVDAERGTGTACDAIEEMLK